jgi:hypothetical protein
MRLFYYFTDVTGHQTAFDFLNSNKHRQNSLPLACHVFIGRIGSSYVVEGPRCLWCSQSQYGCLFVFSVLSTV